MKLTLKRGRQPDGYITLTDGKVLPCWTKPDAPAVIEEDRLELDTTGEFLRIGKPGRRKMPARKVTEPWMDLFFKNAFFLYGHREAILSDSRMFLTPLPFRNVLAYTGASGLRNATLGVYLEWWEACGDAVLKDDDGVPAALTFLLAGSLLTGANDCQVVDREGRIRADKFPGLSFRNLWQTFVPINTRYTEAKQRYEAYTLEECLKELESQEKKNHRTSFQ